MIRYKESARNSHEGWERQSIPIGNGYMGMCIFGRCWKERLQFNEKTLWQGGPDGRADDDYNGGNLEGGKRHLDEIRKALAENDDARVKEIARLLVGKEKGYGMYLNFGDIFLKFGHRNPKDYERGLDLENAVAYVKYSCGSVRYSREFFASYPQNVIAARFTADKAGKLNFCLKLKPARKGVKYDKGTAWIKCSGTVKGNNLIYCAKTEIKTDGKISFIGNTLCVRKASYAEMYLSSGTNYANVYPHYRGETPFKRIDECIKNALSLGYEQLKAQHIEDYRNLFGRMFLKLTDFKYDGYTDDLVKKVKKKTVSDEEMKAFVQMLFDQGRYLLISCSRPGTLPANLQGVWNDSNNPPWGCDYHLNVNLQMCYWHAFKANLAECGLPMLEYMESLRKPGRVTAEIYHGIVSDESNPENGWVCHTQNTPFGWTCPGWEFYWGWSPAASSWMMQNCFEYYEYTEDIEMLRNHIYPMMKENCRFWLQNLIYDKSQDRLVSSPSYSPENGPISIGNTFEQELVWQLFTHTSKAAEILGIDEDFANELNCAKDKLKPLHIGRWGQIKEWYEEDSWYDSVEDRKKGYEAHNYSPMHRHASHLLGVFPGEHITYETPELMQAAKVSLADRGYGEKARKFDSGWGKANKINLWARLKEGNIAYTVLEDMLRNNIAYNLWDLHAPFQFDGNCGFDSGICEMLVYSNENYIELLPALPDIWDKGQVRGICAKGGYTVDLKWENGTVTDFQVYSDTKDNAVVLIDGEKIKVKTAGRENNYVRLNA